MPGRRFGVACRETAFLHVPPPVKVSVVLWAFFARRSLHALHSNTATIRFSHPGAGVLVFQLTALSLTRNGQFFAYIITYKRRPLVRDQLVAVARTNTPSAELTPTKPLSRREFLYCVWGASAGVLLAGAGGAAIWYALPHPRFGVRLFRFDPMKLPSPNSPPLSFPDGKLWLSNTVKGLLLLDGTCTFDFYQIKCVDANERFECPLCGSKFAPDGTKVRGNGPARRALDRFILAVRTHDGSPVDIQDAVEIIVDTNRKILGKPRA